MIVSLVESAFVLLFIFYEALLTLVFDPSFHLSLVMYNMPLAELFLFKKSVVYQFRILNLNEKNSGSVS